jgi:hypothetical protein
MGDSTSLRNVSSFKAIPRNLILANYLVVLHGSGSMSLTKAPITIGFQRSLMAATTLPTISLPVAGAIPFQPLSPLGDDVAELQAGAIHGDKDGRGLSGDGRRFT